jgi:hypothetical protein
MKYPVLPSPLSVNCISRLTKEGELGVHCVIQLWVNNSDYVLHSLLLITSTVNIMKLFQNETNKRDNGELESATNIAHLRQECHNSKFGII